MNAIDTNILVYRVDHREPQKQAIATRLLDDLYPQSKTVLMWQVLAEFANWLTQQRNRESVSNSAVRAYLNAIREEFVLTMPAPESLDLALELAVRHTLSHWDSMLVAACLNAGVTTLYTEDMGAPRTLDSLELVNPFLDQA